MPIQYSVSDDGHFIHAVASGSVTSQEIVEYEVAHAIDERLRAPIAELLEIQPGALSQVTKDDISAILTRRKEAKIWPKPHRCGIVVSMSDVHAWDLAKFYEGLAILHSPEVVIVFSDVGTARSWLGFNNFRSKKAASGV